PKPQNPTEQIKISMLIEAKSQRVTAQGTPMMSKPGITTIYEYFEFSKKGPKRGRNGSPLNNGAPIVVQGDLPSNGILIIPGLKEELHKLDSDMSPTQAQAGSP
ncbi:MAG: hypothetical protein ACKO96_15365, partial [Flammeovirgaceae bacterium]